jgi:hypothetical protein
VATSETEATGTVTSEQRVELERFGRDIDYFNDHYDELLA